MVALLCPVRGCGLELHADERVLVCSARHSFDRSKSGYVNLLTPQDKRARDPGDSREAVLARRRTSERGLTSALVDAIIAELKELAALDGSSAVLDVGCGDGFMLAAIAERFGCEAWGVDISREAIELAARRHPRLRWIVANADRRMPFADASFRAALTVTGPKNAGELRRLLTDDGLLVVAVSGPDDQAELREAVLGAAHAVDRGARMEQIFGEHFELVRAIDARQIAHLDKDSLRDLLAGSYRGARHAAQRRFDAIDSLDITLSHRVLAFRPRLSLGATKETPPHNNP
jgi:23S rRNA (guanine745-N1)-methyltransferase